MTLDRTLQVTGAIITSAYVFYTLISLLLAFNRLVQVTSRSYYEMLFGNAGMAVRVLFVV